jgi:hypothetical protein
LNENEKFFDMSSVGIPVPHGKPLRPSSNCISCLLMVSRAGHSGIQFPLSTGSLESHQQRTKNLILYLSTDKKRISENFQYIIKLKNMRETLHKFEPWIYFWTYSKIMFLFGIIPQDTKSKRNYFKLVFITKTKETIMWI